MMNLRFQIEEQKRNSHMLGDFVIDTTYIKDLASKVFHADDKLKTTAQFQDTCETLSRLCDEVSVSVKDLKDRIPILPLPDPETIPPVE